VFLCIIYLFLGYKIFPEEWFLLAPVTLFKQFILFSFFKTPKKPKINASLNSIISEFGMLISEFDNVFIRSIKNKLYAPPPVIKATLFFSFKYFEI